MESPFRERAEEVHTFRAELSSEETSTSHSVLPGFLHTSLVPFPLFLEAFAPRGDVGSVSVGSVHVPLLLRKGRT